MNLKTQSIKYIGSKKNILGKILKIISVLASKEKIVSILDGFSGSTRVSQMLANNGYKVLANDTASYSKILAECYLLNKTDRESYKNKTDNLNQLIGFKGWFSKNYGGSGDKKISIGEDGKKKMFQYQNTKKLDAMISEIHKEKDTITKSTLLTSLMLSLDKVDSSLGHQVSYLKEWASRSYNKLSLEVPDYAIHKTKNRVYQEDILRLIKKIKVDLAYFDPPYCSNNEKMPASRVRYNSYYHIWNSICLNDQPEVFGASNRRKDTSDRLALSEFEEFKKDAKTNEYITTLKIKELIKNTNAKFILLSYSSNGRSSKADLIKVFNGLKLKFIFWEFDYKKNIMFELKSTNEYSNQKGNKEYLSLIDKRSEGSLSNIENQLNKIFDKPLQLSFI